MITKEQMLEWVDQFLSDVQAEAAGFSGTEQDEVDARILTAIRSLVESAPDQEVGGVEGKCQRCGGRNLISWYVDSDTWNVVMGPGRAEIVCPICFSEIAKKKGISPAAWRLSKEGDDPDPEDVKRLVFVSKIAADLLGDMSISPEDLEKKRWSVGHALHNALAPFVKEEK